MLRVKKGMLLKQIKDQGFVIPMKEMQDKFNGMIRLNDTGILYWKELERGTTEDALTAMTLEKFENVSEETARRDVEAFISTVRFALEEE